MKQLLTLLHLIICCCLLNTQSIANDIIVPDDVTMDTVGVYIQGNIGIFGEDTLSLFGDVYLDQAKQVGDGVIALSDTKPQLLVSNNSQINNLLINNSSRVTLEGKITISNSLTIHNGVFDIRRGNLQLNAPLSLSKDGILLKNQDTSSSIKVYHKITFSSQNCISEIDNISIFNYFSLLTIQISQKRNYSQSDYYSLFTPPPELQNQCNV